MKRLSIRILIVFSLFLLPQLLRSQGLLLTQYRYQKKVEKLKNKSQYSNIDSISHLVNTLHSLPVTAQDTIWKKISKTISNELFLLSEDKRSSFWDSISHYFIIDIPYFAHQSQKNNLNTIAYNASLLSKGFLLNSSTVCQRLSNLLKEDSLVSDIHLYQDFLKHKNLDRIYVENNTRNSEEKIIWLEKRLKRINSIITLKNLSLIKELTSLPFTITWKDIQNSLEKNDIAIEFINFPIENENTYFALSIRKEDSIPQMTLLFKESEIILKNSYPIVDESAAYELIWKKLKPYIAKDIENIYFSPSGLLHRIAIEYLPDENDLPINWEYNLYRLSSTKELILASPSSNDKLKCILLGGIDYSSKLDLSSHTNINKDFHEDSARKVANDLRDAISDGVKYLPYTLSEVEKIRDCALDYDIESSIVSGKDGTEAYFKNLSKTDMNILHIATHGFYLSEDDNNDSIQTSSSEDRMLRQSGLLLAGANRSFQQDYITDTYNDGVLTAEDVSFLDFSQTDLVTLSACESALGENSSSEGVYGLQRGFKKAGVQSIVASLWPVSDIATSIFMTNFYSYYFKTRNKFKSLRLAQQALCRAQGGKYNSPKYWATFILIDGFDTQKTSLMDEEIKLAKADFKDKEIENRKELAETTNDALVRLWNERRDAAMKKLAKDIQSGISHYNLK